MTDFHQRQIAKLQRFHEDITMQDKAFAERSALHKRLYEQERARLVTRYRLKHLQIYGTESPHDRT